MFFGKNDVFELTPRSPSYVDFLGIRLARQRARKLERSAVANHSPTLEVRQYPEVNTPSVRGGNY